MRAISAVLLILFLSPALVMAEDGPPPVMREFRGVWVATVGNIDWPSKPGLPVETQKTELLAILDRADALNFNAIVLQVRPAADALYASKLEPWSTYLTGKQGQPPEPFYDPLKFAVREAHARGLQLHAWINPYRAQYRNAKGGLAKTHISQTHPDLVKTYGRYLWMDPGEPAVQDHSMAVVVDIITRYDVDGIHLDDYFYPYKERDEEGNITPFPDDASYKRYQESGGKLDRDDWRRSNVDQFIQRLYKTVKTKRPEVLVGLSPFGIWRPGHPEQIQGFDAYAQLYADSRKWLRNGWCDYFTPQLYWPVGQTAQDYIALQDWWIKQNYEDRHLWPGLYTSRVGGEWEPIEIIKQIKATRAAGGAGGNIHFSMRALMGDWEDLEEAIAEIYAEPALVPASGWLVDERPRPAQDATVSESGVVTWNSNESASNWVVQFRTSDVWRTRILPGAATKVELPAGAENAVITTVNRIGLLSEPTPVESTR